MFVLVVVLYAVGAVLGLMAALGQGQLGPFATQPLAMACIATGLCTEVVVYGRRRVG